MLYNALVTYKIITNDCTLSIVMPTCYITNAALGYMNAYFLKLSASVAMVAVQ